MRKFLTRLALTGVVGLALSGCGTSNGTPLAGSAGGGGSVPSTNGVGSAPAGYAPPITIDNGTEPPAYAAGPNAFSVTDSQSTLNSELSPKAGDPGSHLITYSTDGATTITFKYGGEVPSLVYKFGIGTNGGYFNYSKITFDAYNTLAATPPGKFSSYAIELTGGSGVAAYDAKIICATLPPPASGATPPPPTAAAPFTTYTCLVPAYGAASGTYTTAYNAEESKFTETGPTGTGTVNTFAAGLVTLQSPTVYVDAIFTAPALSSTGNMLGIDNVVAHQ